MRDMAQFGLQGLVLSDSSVYNEFFLRSVLKHSAHTRQRHSARPHSDTGADVRE